MKTFMNWLLYSSANSRKISLTVKAAMLAVIPTVIYVSGISNLGLDEATLTQFAGAVAQVVEVSLTVVSTVIGVYGLARKIFLTAIGRNPNI